MRAWLAVAFLGLFAVPAASAIEVGIPQQGALQCFDGGVGQGNTRVGLTPEETGFFIGLIPPDLVIVTIAMRDLIGLTAASTEAFGIDISEEGGSTGVGLWYGAGCLGGDGLAPSLDG